MTIGKLRASGMLTVRSNATVEQAGALMPERHVSDLPAFDSSAAGLPPGVITGRRIAIGPGPIAQTG